MALPAIDSLEKELFELGQLERSLETSIRELPALIRTATHQGDFQRADELAAAYDIARSKLCRMSAGAVYCIDTSAILRMCNEAYTRVPLPSGVSANTLPE